MKDAICIAKIVVNFLERLSEEQIDDLLNNKARLKFEAISDKKAGNKGKEEEDTLYHSEKLNGVKEKINAFTSTDEARGYFESMAFTKKELKAIANMYEMPVANSDTNRALAEKLIKNLVGSRIRFDTLLSITW